MAMTNNKRRIKGLIIGGILLSASTILLWFMLGLQGKDNRHAVLISSPRLPESKDDDPQHDGRQSNPQSVNDVAITDGSDARAQISRTDTSSFSREQTLHITIPIQPNSAFTLYLFDDVALDISWDELTELDANKRFLRGRLFGEELSTVSITLIGNHYLMSVQDMRSGKTYRLRGNQAEGTAHVTEIDLSAMPPQTHEHFNDE